VNGKLWVPLNSNGVGEAKGPSFVES
jgi:hypothetical protein